MSRQPNQQKEAARQRVAQLVGQFRQNERDYSDSRYNETQARTDFITPLLEALGWDVHNTKGHSLALREVIEEATVEVDEQLSKKPDYELRLARQRKLFVEAKKPSVRIDRDRAAAFQVRRYGYSASMPISILINFRQLAVYDCLHPPRDTDEAHVARISLFGFEEFEARFDELWDLFSREVVYSGDFDRRFAVGVTRRGANQFDDYFLRQVRAWRERLAVDIHANTPGLTPAELTYFVQLFLSRIVFLRICEDREIEKYATLQSLDQEATFAALTGLVKRADAFYDSGLFRILDDERLRVRVSDETLRSIIEELYYPQSPYTFAVVETEVLGEIYEQFLGEVISIADGAVRITYKPEIRESGGVVPTPRYIVDAIVERTLSPLISGRGPADLSTVVIADICCGSGIFLLSVYEFLLEHYLTWYLNHDRNAHIGSKIYETVGGRWRLTFEEKRRILLTHVRGVDIDANAVEVAQFSILLKLIESETAADLRDFVDRTNTPALPPLDNAIRCGNSLVSEAEWDRVNGAMPVPLVQKVNPFNWQTEFPEIMGRGGFDVIVGNPPYIRIQNMAAYSPEETRFYQDARSPFSTARQDNFDKYALFIERSISLLAPTGRLGVIVPHKFMTIQSGRTLRRLISAGRHLLNIVHFGAKQVFGVGTSNYTCLLVLGKSETAQVEFELAGPLEEWRYGKRGAISEIPADQLSEEPWRFADADTNNLFAKARAAAPNALAQVAEIFVGVQTSADDIYIFKPVAEDEQSFTLRWDDRDWLIEREILRPCLHDVILHAYARPSPNAWMIFPYAIEMVGGREKARLFQPPEMERRFPGCWEYLNARRAELEKRQIVGGSRDERQWYQFGRSQSLTKLNTPKIILPALSLDRKYTYDENNIVVTGGGNGPYYMLRPEAGAPVSNFYLLAVLNHPLSEAFVRTNTSTFRGGYYSHGKQFIEGLPIPIPTDAQRTEIDRLVEELIASTDRIEAARTPHARELGERHAGELKQRIESAVSAIFGLSAEEDLLARSVPIPE